MAQGIYRVNEPIVVTYQATKATSGLIDVTMIIYDETHTLDGVNFPDVVFIEIGATGRYYGSFTPDMAGVWTILIDSVTKKGEVVKQFNIVDHNIDSIGNAVDNIVSADSAPMVG